MQVVNIQEEIINRAAEQMSKEIDFGVLTSMLCEIGWTKVVLKPMTDEQSKAIDAWVAMYVHNPVETMGLVWVFEDRRDAVNFTLKWL